MSFEMQLKINEKWVAIAKKGEPPYRYKTQELAVRMLEICYPEQCRTQRLEGIHPPYENGTVVRVVESPEPANQDWEG